MDYDDNDFQCQSSHLAGEGSTKYPPVLQPFALPRFDFDDSLQGHLRFDSLVDSEVFLGIESNEDNQWIEDFSRGNSAIGFNPTGTEPSSVSRRNNVWSEATSSESVEMLLKSVGQEEMNPLERTTYDSVSCTEIGSVTGQMEPSSKNDGNLLSNVGDATDLQPVSTSNEIPGSFTGMKEDLQTEGGSTASEGDLINAEHCTDGNQVQMDILNEKPLDNWAGDSSTSDMQIDNKVKCDTEVGSQEGSHKSTEKGEKHTDDEKGVQNQIMTNKEVQMSDQNLGGTGAESVVSNLDNPSSDSKLESVVEYNKINETILSTVEGTSNVTLKSDSLLQIPVDFSKAACSTGSQVKDSEIVAPSVDVQTSAKLNVDMPRVSSLSPRDDTDPHTQVEEDSKTIGVFASSDLKADTPAQMRCSVQEDVLPKSSLKSNTKSSAGESEKSFLAAKKDVDAKNDEVGSNNAHGEGISSLTVVQSFADPLSKPHAVGVVTDDSGACSEVKDPEPNTVVPSSRLDDLKQKHDEETENAQIDGSNCGDNGPETEEGGPGMSADGNRNKEQESGSTFTEKGSASVPLAEGSGKEDKLELKSQHESDSEPVKTTNISEGKSAAEVSVETSLSSPAVPSVGVCNLSSGTVSVKVASSDPRVEEGSQEICNKSPPVADLNSEKSHQKATEIRQEANETMEVYPALSDTGVKDGSSVEVTVSLGKEQAVSQANNATTSEVAGDVSKPLEGSLGPAPVSGCEAKLKQLDSGDDHAVAKNTYIPQTGDKAKEYKVSGDQRAEDSEQNDKASSKVLPTAQCSEGNNSSKEKKNLTPEISSPADVVGVEAQKNLQHAVVISGSAVSQILGETPSRGNVQQSGGEVAQGGSKGTSERKSRRSSGKAVSKENAKKGNSTKETTPSRRGHRGSKSVNTSFSASGICSPMKSPGLHHFNNVEGSGGKSFGVLTSPTSGLPDLNTSAAAPPLFHQPFTDLQQVQLRAQIFVYGALIQGTIPDEACMVAAFGGTDGGRSTWENAWRTSMERLQSQKLHSTTPETPLQSHIGSRVSDQINNTNSSRSKVNATSVDRGGSKSTPSSVANPMIPLSSPLWTVPTPSGDALQASGAQRGAVFDYKQPISPLQPYQTPPTRNLVGQNTSWMSQASFRGPWVVPPQTSGLDSSTRFTAFPPTEIVQLTPVKELSLPLSSGVKHVPAGSMTQSGYPGNMLPGTSPTVNSKAMVTPSVQQSESKRRKRKKASEDPGQSSVQPQSNVEPVSVHAGSSHPSADLGTVTTPVSGSKAATEKLIVSALPSRSVEHSRKQVESGEKTANLSEETLNKVKEAKVQAEDAASIAAAATNHCQELWSRLAEQTTSRLVPDVEARLASAAAAIAAATCVAKAAAAAANVASNAALQAKLMADEVLVLNYYGNVVSDDVNREKATPASSLKGGNVPSASNSIIGVAKEAARRRVEAATAASKQAENMDAIVKAAELAAEAVSHAGKIVSLGDPIALSELVRSGPEGYWKLPRPHLVGNSNDERIERLVIGSGEAPDASEMHSKGGASDNVVAPANEGGMSGSVAASKKNVKGKKSHKSAGVGVVPESETAGTSATIQRDEGEGQTSIESNIQKGSHVEVHKDGDGSGAWYQANVLELHDGKAFVCYTELKSDEGSGYVKEWVPIHGENEAPRIRIARPMGATQFEGRRKRRRAAIGDYKWSVGDRVDAWVQDRWCEGVITDKSKNDDTTFTVQFSGLEQPSDVKAWHIRPSLIWKDGQWIECLQSRDKEKSLHETDSPLGKRRKMASAVMEKGKSKMPQSSNSTETGKSEDIKLLDLAANEKLFNIGKSNRDEKKQGSLRSLRTNLQKEGSRVVFGVPKPGKKRKFMEVSKHYTADRGSKNSEANESKIAKYLMPRGSGIRGARGTSKNDLKGKRGTETKPSMPKSGRYRGASARSISHKDKALDAPVSAPAGEAATEHNGSLKESTSNIHDKPGKHGADEYGSVSRSEGSATEDSFVFSSVATSSNAPSGKTTSSNKTVRANKGKLAPAGAKKVEEDRPSGRNQANTSSDVAEPRRSNRRIQPTSRLLEGLQSSFISKIPTVSHDKGQHRSALRGTNRG